MRWLTWLVRMLWIVFATSRDNILLLFVMVPLLELYVLVAVYGFAGPWTVLGSVFVTSLLGVWCFAWQAEEVVKRAYRAISQCRFPADEMAEAIALAMACALLVTPGYLTDALGFALLAPGLRIRLSEFLFDRLWVGDVFDLMRDAELRR